MENMAQMNEQPKAAFMKVLFMDLDNTVREPIDPNQKFVQDPDDFKLIDGVAERIYAYMKANYLLIGVTNQGGIAYGHKTVQTLTAGLQNLNQMLLAELKKIDETVPFAFFKIYSCPYMEGGTAPGFGIKSLLRKPYYGMFVQAELDLQAKHNIVINYNGSLMVGDRDEDKKAALSADIDFQNIDDFLGKTELNG